MKKVRLLTPFVVTLLATTLYAGDWTRFRGPGGSGVSDEEQALPAEWSPSANLAWKTELPGPGVSSPIIVGERVFVTCYTGYGLDRQNPGDIADLKRHLLCFDLKSGEKLWQQDVPAAQPEDPYTGIGVPAHGYASHTPVSDGEKVFAFFGKSGVYAFDLEGNKLWSADVGTESDPWKWGSAASPVIYEDKVIVPAAAESQSIVAFDKSTGKEQWRAEAAGLDGSWGTPTLVQVNEDRTDLVMSVPKEVWGLDPETGELLWHADATGAEQAHASPVVKDGVLYAFTGRGGGSVALKVGGEGDTSDSAVLWSGNETARFSSPIEYQSKLYLVSGGVVAVIDAESGEEVSKERLSGAARSRGGFGSLDYPSPVIGDGKLYYLNGTGQMFVFELGDELKQVSVNRVAAESESFGGTPAISDGHIVFRSDKHLYCITDKDEAVSEEDKKLASAEPSDSEDRPSFGGGFGRGGFGGGDRGGRPGFQGGRPQGPGSEGRPNFGGRGGRGGFGPEEEDKRPERPQRPE